MNVGKCRRCSLFLCRWHPLVVTCMLSAGSPISQNNFTHAGAMFSSILTPPRAEQARIPLEDEQAHTRVRLGSKRIRAKHLDSSALPRRPTYRASRRRTSSLRDDESMPACLVPRRADKPFDLRCTTRCCPHSTICSNQVEKDQVSCNISLALLYVDPPPVVTPLPSACTQCCRAHKTPQLPRAPTQMTRPF